MFLYFKVKNDYEDRMKNRTLCQDFASHEFLMHARTYNTHAKASDNGKPLLSIFSTKYNIDNHFHFSTSAKRPRDNCENEAASCYCSKTHSSQQALGLEMSEFNVDRHIYFFVNKVKDSSNYFSPSTEQPSQHSTGQKYFSPA